MNTTRLRKIPQAMKIAFASGAIAMAAMPSAVVAQEASNADDNVEVIQVKGIRSSQRANINAKRFATGIVDSITAEDIGKFPDKNVAETLSRVPGITIDRDFGEGQAVTIRGVQPDRNLTLLNGQAVGTAQWFVLDSAGRNFNFEMLASEMVAGVEVYKSAQADIDEGANGGTVILRTRKPLELESNTFSASVEAQYSDLAEETDPSFSGLFSWKDDKEEFGLLVSTSYQERTVRRETNEDFGWFGPSVSRLTEGFQVPVGADRKGALPWGMGSALFQQDRERVGFDVTAQWAPSDDLDMTLHYLSSTLNADNVNSNLIGIGFNGIYNTTSPGTVNSNGIIESLQVRGGDIGQFIAYDNIFRPGSEMSTQVLDFEGNLNLENGKLHWQVGNTVGDSVNNDFFTEFWAPGDDPRNGLNFFNPGGTAPAIDFVGANPWMTNPTDQMWLGGIFDQRNTAEDKETYFQLDYTHEVEWGAITSIKSGAKYRDRSFKQDRYRTDLQNLAATYEGSLGPAGDYWSGEMLNVAHAETNGFGASYFFPNQATMRSALYGVNECAAGTPEGEMCRRSNRFLSEASYQVEEEIRSLYTMANFEDENLRGNIGLRYVETDQDSSGYDLATGNPITFNGDYSAWLPSINLSYDLADDVVLRAAASKTVARASPFQLSASFNLTPETSSGAAGNPFLKPERASTMEMGVEWYFSEASIFAVTFYNRDLSDIIVNQIVARNVNGQQINQLDTPVNAGSATVEGFEVQIQHLFDNGFGGYFNFTYNDAGNIQVGNTTAKVPFNSRTSYNAGVYYEDDDFSARLNYTLRSENFRAVTEFGNRYREEQAQLDAQVSYVVSENITVKLEAINLTDEIWENYYLRSTDNLRVGGTQSQNGRRFFAGASFSF